MWSGFDTAPTVAMQRAADQPLLAGIEPQDRVALVAADDLRIGAGGARDLAAAPGFSSTLCTIVPTGMARSGMALPGFTSTCSPETTVSPAARRCGARM